MLTTRHQNSNDKRKRKTTNTTITFRINTDTLNKLRADSAKHGRTLNNSVNQILKRYVQWDMFESQAGIIPFAKPVISELLANMSKEEIASLAKNAAKNAVLDSMLVMRGKIDLNSFLSWFEILMKKASIEINHTVENGDNTHKYIVKHNLGENWAFLIENLLQTIFNDTLGIRIDITNLSNTTLMLQI